MKKKRPLKNVAASVKERLRQIHEKTNEDYQLLLNRHVIERFLYRLSLSQHKDRFVLKGALLFVFWNGAPHRMTRDVDLLGFGASSIEALVKVIKEVCAVAVEDDGVVFDASSVTGEDIRAQEAYVGVRVLLRATLERSVVPMQIDVGFGDDFSVAPVEIDLPSLLQMPSPRLKAYRQETAIAEKLEALVGFGLLNSRMKDYYDFWFLAHHFEFSGQELCDSIQATFARRKTPLPVDLPAGLTEEFSGDRAKQTGWQTFWKKSVKLEPMPPLAEVVLFAASFLAGPALAAAKGEKFPHHWQAGGPWK